MITKNITRASLAVALIAISAQTNLLPGLIGPSINTKRDSPDTMYLYCSRSNRVSLIFTRTWWYHDVITTQFWIYPWFFTIHLLYKNKTHSSVSSFVSFWTQCINYRRKICLPFPNCNPYPNFAKRDFLLTNRFTIYPYCKTINP